MREWEIHSPQTLRFLGNLSVLGGQESLQNIDKLIKTLEILIVVVSMKGERW